MGTNHNSYAPLYSFSSGMVVSHPLSMQKVERDMNAMLHAKRNDDLKRASGTSSLTNLQSQELPDPNFQNNPDRTFANILSPHLRNRPAHPVRKGDFLSVNIDDTLYQSVFKNLRTCL